MTNPSPVPVPVGPDTHLRRGVSDVDPADNVLAVLPADTYPADAQCTGATVTVGGATNFWWVRITANGQTGWVSAVTVLVGADNEPIPGVAIVPTVNV